MKVNEKKFLLLSIIMLSAFSLSGMKIFKPHKGSVDKLQKTGNGAGENFEGENLQSVCKGLIANPGIIFHAKKNAWVLQSVLFGGGKRPYKINLNGANLKGVDLSNLDLSEVDLGNAICDENTGFSGSIFSKGRSFKGLYFPLWGDFANLSGIEGLYKAKVQGAVFNVFQLSDHFMNADNKEWINVVENEEQLKKQYGIKIDSCKINNS